MQHKLQSLLILCHLRKITHHNIGVVSSKSYPSEVGLNCVSQVLVRPSDVKCVSLSLLSFLKFQPRCPKVQTLVPKVQTWVYLSKMPVLNMHCFLSK